MAGLLRLLSRHWDGKRLLQFLTGLALLALTFGGPAAASAPTPPAAATSTAATTATVRAGAADQAATTDTAASAATVGREVECQHDAGGASRAVPATDRSAPAGAVPGAHGSRAPPRA